MKFISIFCLLALFMATPCTAAETWPDHPITVVNAAPAGGLYDLAIRVACSMLSKELGQPIIHTNVTGGEGGVAINTALKAKHDGYTLLGTGATYLTFTPQNKKVRYSFDDFRILGAISEQRCSIITQPDRPWNTINDAFDWAKKEGKRLTIGYSTSEDRYNMETIARQAGADISMVPQTGGPACLTGVIGGHLDMATIGLLAMPSVKAGKVKMLACIAAEHFTQMPDVPTLKELGYSIGQHDYVLLVGPSDMPEEAALIIEQALRKVVETPEFREEVYGRLAMEPAPADVVQVRSLLDDVRRDIAANLKAQNS